MFQHHATEWLTSSLYSDDCSCWVHPVLHKRLSICGDDRTELYWKSEVKRNSESTVPSGAADLPLRLINYVLFVGKSIIIHVIVEASTCIFCSFLQCRLNCIENTGEIKEHDPHCAACFVQMRVGSLKQVDDGIFNINHRTISKL